VVVGRGFARRLGWVPFEPPLYDTFAFVTRANVHLSPATRVFLDLAEKHLEAMRRRVETQESAVGT
jgi:LysR family transcriptional regulator, cyn operon transcriptional activator